MIKIMLKVLKDSKLFSRYTSHLIKALSTIKAVRYYGSPVKRFYKTTNILESGGKFEITLDQRKLKTPKGSIFTVESEALALAVATEWNSQKDKILQSKLHLTTLCNTVIDNPNNLTKYDMVNYIVNCLDTDTILFQANEDEALFRLQREQWDPVVEWFNQRFGVLLKKSVEMDLPVACERDKSTLTKHLLSHNFAALNGFVYGVDTLKSVLLTLACIEQFISVEKAVLLSRLEEEYQTDHWGRVEWAHDLNQHDLQARLSAVVLFVYFNSQVQSFKLKNL